MGDFEGSLIAFGAVRRLRALLPDGLDSVHKTIARALEQDDLSKALKLANERYARRGVDDYVTALTYACLLVGRELIVEANGVLKKARQAHGDEAALVALSADAAVLEGDLDRARKALASIDPEGVERPEVLAFVADTLLDLAEEDEAIAYYQRAVDRGVDDPEPAIRVGQLYLGRDQTRPAAEAFEYAAKRAKTRTGLWQNTAELWFELGEELRGLEARQRVLELGEADPDEWLELGVRLAQAGRAGEALEALSEVEKFDPFAVEPLIVRGHVLLESGRAEEAMAAFQKVEKLRGERPSAVRGMAEAALMIGDLMLAKDKAERAVDLAEDDPESHHVLGRVLQQFGRHEQALEAIDEAIALDGGEAIYLASRALSLASLGQVAEAKDALQEAVAMADQYPGQLPMWLDERTWQRLEGRVEPDQWKEIGAMLQYLRGEEAAR